MFGRNVRLGALGATATGVLLLGGCSGGEPVASAPPPPEAVAESAPSAPPELLGAAPAPDASSAQDGLLGGATASTPIDVAPIPAAEAGTASPAPMPVPAQSGSLKTWRRPDGTLVTAMKPIANPRAAHPVRHATARSAPATTKPSAKPAQSAAPPAKVAAKPAPKPIKVAAASPPKVVAPPPAALKAVVPPKVTVPVTKAPQVPALAAAKTAPTKPVAEKPLTKLQSLQAALAPAVTKDATLTTAASLAKGEPGQVTLSLPPTLADSIKAEAAKLGLRKAAKTSSAYAKLEGEGYEVTPNGRQTAVIKAGEPTTFAWQVKPGADAKGQVTTQFGVELNGTKTPQSFTLGEITKRVTPLVEKSKASAGGLLDRLGLGSLNREVTLPGGMKAPLKGVIGGMLVLLAVAVLALLARAAAAHREREEQRRKFRTLSTSGQSVSDLDPAPQAVAPVNVVSPMVAAAAVGAAGTTVLAADAATFASVETPAADDPFIIKSDLPPVAVPVALAPAAEAPIAEPVSIVTEVPSLPAAAEALTADPVSDVVETSVEPEAVPSLDLVAAPAVAEAYVNPMIAATAPPVLAEVSVPAVASPAEADAPAVEPGPAESVRELEPAH